MPSSNYARIWQSTNWHDHDPLFVHPRTHSRLISLFRSAPAAFYVDPLHYLGQSLGSGANSSKWTNRFHNPDRQRVSQQFLLAVHWMPHQSLPQLSACLEKWAVTHALLSAIQRHLHKTNCMLAYSRLLCWVVSLCWLNIVIESATFQCKFAS